MRRLLSISALALAAGLATGATQAQTIGSVQLVQVWAYGTPPNAGKRDAFVRDPVVANELVETVDNGALHLKFEDGSELRLGSASSATLDKFVYDPGSRGGEMAVDMTRGAFRFISGKLNESGIRLRTPTALIGIRGTDVLINVDPYGGTIIAVLAGVVAVQNLNAGGAASVSVAAGQAVAVAANSTAAPTVAAAPNEMDEGLEDATPGPTGPGTGVGPGSASGGGDEQGSSPGYN